MATPALVFLALRAVVTRRYGLLNGLGVALSGILFAAWGLSDPHITARMVTLYAVLGTALAVVGTLLAYQQGTALLVEDATRRMADLCDAIVQGLAPPSLAEGEVWGISVPGNASHRESALPGAATGSLPTSAAWGGNHGLQRWLPAQTAPNAPPAGTHLPSWFVEAFAALRVHQGVDLRPILPYTIGIQATVGPRSAHQRLAAQRRLQRALGLPFQG